MDWESVLAWWGWFLPAFVLTFLIELPAYLLGWASLGWLRRGARAALRPVPAIGLVFLLNLITHPLLWLASGAAPGLLVIFELAVVAVEGLVVALLIRRRLGPQRPGSRARPEWAWLVSLGANALSVLAGMVVLRLIMDLLAGSA
ncbi:hypothetical protein [Microlunatus speluncae]|uniref:hypothetical protein n=1 Tax=Microlunatus speluncae TaxID=2594267 RepID=UPI0012667968|nr:hypothetical protein [Microlunatus speluncae]